MIASARNLYILRRLNESGIVDYKSVASELGVSEATVRRDFEKLEEQGKLRRVRSGAVRSGDEENGFDAELSIRAKNTLNTQEKLTVATAAAEVVQPGESVFLDAGTSISPLGSLLLSMPIRIVTYNNAILQRMTPKSRAEVFALGGQLMPADQMIVGPIAERALENFRFDRAFIGCMGLDVDSNTVYVTDMECMRLKELAIRNAKVSYLLADRSKLRKVGLFRICGLDAFERVYLEGPQPEGKFPDNMTFAEPSAKA